MDYLLLRFWKIYQQFVDSKSVLSEEGMNLFNVNFYFDTFVLLEKEFKEEMSIEE